MPPPAPPPRGKSIEEKRHLRPNQEGNIEQNNPVASQDERDRREAQPRRASDAGCYCHMASGEDGTYRAPRLHRCCSVLTGPGFQYRIASLRDAVYVKAQPKRRRESGQLRLCVFQTRQQKIGCTNALTLTQNSRADVQGSVLNRPTTIGQGRSALPAFNICAGNRRYKIFRTLCEPIGTCRKSHLQTRIMRQALPSANTCHYAPGSSYIVQPQCPPV